MSFLPHIVEERANSNDAARPNRPQWYAVQTRGRHEKKVTRQISDRGLDGFLPLATEMHRWSDRHMRVDAPLYPCYTFLHACIDSAIRTAVLRIPGVLHFVGFSACPQVIPDREMEVIQRLIKHSVPVRSHVFLNEGTRVRICGGALDGIEGILVRRNSDASLIVSVQLIQRSVALRMDGYDVEPV
jgi:transcriptional antiterminator NusG